MASEEGTPCLHVGLLHTSCPVCGVYFLRVTNLLFNGFLQPALYYLPFFSAMVLGEDCVQNVSDVCE